MGLRVDASAASPAIVSLQQARDGREDSEHDTLDPRRWLRDHDLVTKELREAGIDVTFVIVQNGDHGLTAPNMMPTAEEVQRMIGEFRDRGLANPEPMPTPEE